MINGTFLDNKGNDMTCMCVSCSGSYKGSGSRVDTLLTVRIFVQVYYTNVKLYLVRLLS